jgi:hypothetical protein
MKARNGWLFPLMVLAAGSVTVFGCIGIAAITGYLPLAKVSAMPFSGVTAFDPPPPSLSRSQPPRAVATAAPAPAVAVHSEHSKADPLEKKSNP